MNNWKELSEKALIHPNNIDVWADIIVFDERKHEELKKEELRNSIIQFFKSKNEEIPNEVEISMNTEWSGRDYHDYLSCVTY